MNITVLEFDKCIKIICESTLDCAAVKRDIGSIDTTAPQDESYLRGCSDRMMGAARRRQTALDRIVAALGPNLIRKL